MHFKKASRNGDTVNHPPIDLIFLFLQYLEVLFLYSMNMQNSFSVKVGHALEPVA